MHASLPPPSADDATARLPDILTARILIVDDLPSNVAELEHMLRGAGYSGVTSSSDPRAVCELHRRNHYHLILLDLQTPGRDEFEMLAGLKEIEPDGSCPLLVITAAPEPKLGDLKSGPRDFITKPFVAAEVLRCVRHLLEIRQLHRNEAVFNQGRLENSQRIATLGDWDYDFANHRLVWSDEVYRILGIPRQDFPASSETFYCHVHPEDLAFVRREKLLVMTGFSRVEFEHRIIRPDGAVRHIHQIAEIFFDSQGQPLRESGTIQDITERKTSQEALRTSEARFRALSESAPLGIFECNAAGCAIYNNPALTALSGRPVNVAPGQGWSDSIHPDDSQAVSADWKRTVAAGREWDQELRLARPDGSVRWVHSLAAPGKDAAGHVTGFIGTVEDITERRQAEIVIRESEERYRKMVMLSPDAHFVHVDGRITFANRAFCRLMGVTDPAAYLGRMALEVVHPDYHDFVRGLRQRLFRGDQAIPPFDVRFVRADGTAVEVEAACVAFEFGGHPEVQVSARDISARKREEEELRGKTALFEAQINSSIDGIIVVDADGKKIIQNGRFIEMMRLPPALAEGDDPAGRLAHVASLARDPAKMTARVAYLYAHPQEAARDELIMTDGAVFDLNSAPILGKEGRYYGRIWTFRDITENKAAEAQYLRAQRMESIGTLAGGIAHDLNNVLAPIMMSVELLKLETGDDPRRRKILDAIQVSSRRGADLVRQVLSFARGLDGERAVLRLGPLVADLEAIISGTFPRSLCITTQVPADLWPVIGDSTQLHQVLLNLAVNARDAMPQGGALTVRATNVAMDDQFAGASPGAKAGGYVLIEVIDTGMGIPPEVRERIFEPFFTTKEFGKGTGIGLTTVHTIIKSHGGFLQVESEVGRGTNFKVYLPADPDTLAAAPEAPVPAKVPRGGDELVLVVDDDEGIRDITRQTLEAYGYRVLTASDGAQAVALYAQQGAQIALVVTDMMMPVMDGAATIRVLRHINPEVKILAASGLAVAENVAKAIGAGALDFLPKPFTAQTLRHMVRKAIDQPACAPTS